MPQSASLVVGRPLTQIESHFWPVTNWATCLGDVESVNRLGHERFAIGLKAGRRVEDVVVAVRWNARHHRFSWKALEGPAWSGELKMTPVNGRRTRLQLEVAASPRTFLGGLAEMVGITQRDVTDDLRRISDLVESLPAPVRPSRLLPGQQVAEPDVAALAIPRPRRESAPVVAQAQAQAQAEHEQVQEQVLA